MSITLMHDDTTNEVVINLNQILFVEAVEEKVLAILGEHSIIRYSVKIHTVSIDPIELLYITKTRAQTIYNQIRTSLEISDDITIHDMGPNKGFIIVNNIIAISNVYYNENLYQFRVHFANNVLMEYSYDTVAEGSNMYNGMIDNNIAPEIWLLTSI